MMTIVEFSKVIGNLAFFTLAILAAVWVWTKMAEAEDRRVKAWCDKRRPAVDRSMRKIKEYLESRK